ncbi:MAG: flagellar basal body P-ring formation protein FlgA [Tabrizicola sp.]|jgi:flagella basal body P-ring formation protein FlgA|nr:flagellar basal body P-ring formation protein FlgA [Tabrizicola sp.]
MRSLLILLLAAQPALAESLVATRTIRAQTVIGPDDVTLVAAVVPGAATDLGQVLGLETRIAIYAGKPVQLSDLGPPTLIDRNQIVPLIYLSGSLAIATEGRALDRGAEGEVIRIMNLGSRTTVSGRIGPDGSVYVGWED